MRKIHTHANNQKGQVAFEFLLVFTFALGITFMFLYMSVNYVAGYLVHYATFMASRTFLVADDGGKSIPAVLNYAENRARDAIKNYQLDTFNISPNALKIIKPGQGQKAVYVGATFKFQKLLSPLKAVGGKEMATFFSESLLGKEPVRRTCYDRICEAMGQTQCDMNMDITLFDDGC